MDKELFDLSTKLLGSQTYVQQASDSKTVRKKTLRTLFEQRRLFDEPLDEMTITMILSELSEMDSNNFRANCGVGEREGRVFSDIVARRHFWLAHGIGRSGSLLDVQPKAAGSSLLSKLANELVLNVIREICGIRSAALCFVVPMATGMALTLCLLTLRQRRPKSKYVIWSRIDQKSAFKCIITAGLEPIIVQGVLRGDEICTDVDTMRQMVTQRDSDAILCVLSTTSCFAPRAFDDLGEIGSLCAEYDIPHVVNNAYGLQSSKACHLIESTHRSNGRIDCFVQSTDKNFMVPVAGAIVAGFDDKFVKEIAETYPGRASAVPSVDIFITLLEMGRNGYKRLLAERKQLFNQLKASLTDLAQSHGLKVLDTPGNKISIAVAFPESASDFEEPTSPKNSLTALGAKLFMRCVSGCRVVPANVKKEICGFSFTGWGSHHSVYPSSYFTAAASIGMTQGDIDLFISRFDRILKDEERKFEK